MASFYKNGVSTAEDYQYLAKYGITGEGAEMRTNLRIGMEDMLT
jgi:hypothetical protein